MRTKLIILIAGFCLALCTFGCSKHVVVYYEPGRFGGWPANHGIWCWGNEILVGFDIGYYEPNNVTHSIDRTKPSDSVFARSIDGGEHWQIERPNNFIFGLSMGLIGQKEQQHFNNGIKVQPSPGNINFANPDFAFTCRMTSFYRGYSNFYFSYDKGRNWNGPYELPSFEQKAHFGRTDYLINGPNECMMFLTAVKQNGKEGRPFCAKTIDSGKNWQFVSWMAPEPDQNEMVLMPSTVRICENHLVSAVRRVRGKEGDIIIYSSNNNGNSWEFLAEAAKNGHYGNPPSMIKLKDGRLCLTYGYRAAPYGIKAKLSSDNGKTWGKEIILRQDGRTWDLGYPRTVQRKDGKIVTVYYFTDKQHPEQYIAATIWDANSVK